MADAPLSPVRHAVATPEHPAAVDFAAGAGAGSALTYRQLDDRSRRLAGLWRQRGLGPGDHVAVLLDNQARCFEVTWAAQRSGLFLTPVNWHLGADEAGYIVRDCGARALVSSARLGPLPAELAAGLPDTPTRLLGVNVYPREIEDVLVMHPAVTDVAVIGVPDDEMGERLLAVVQAALVTSGSGSPAEDELGAELQRYCRERLAGFKVPRDVVFVDELPRLPTGKIRKSELRAQHGTWSGRVTAEADR